MNLKNLSKMKYQQRDFVLTIENDDSPIIITVPHGGMKNNYGSWLETFFKPRIKSDNPDHNFIQGEKIVTGGDGQIMHIVSDILKEHRANVIAGLLPRLFVDYNRFVPAVAYADAEIKIFYEAYHAAICETIERLKRKWKTVFLFDFHGFGRQPIAGMEFDIILGSNDGESTPQRIDKLWYDFLHELYQVFCVGMDGQSNESDLYKGDTSNLYYYKKYGIDSLLVEISPKFRSSRIKNSQIYGKKLAKDLGIFFNTFI